MPLAGLLDPASLGQLAGRQRQSLRWHLHVPRQGAHRLAWVLADLRVQLLGENSDLFRLTAWLGRRTPLHRVLWRLPRPPGKRLQGQLPHQGVEAADQIIYAIVDSCCDGFHEQTVPLTLGPGNQPRERLRVDKTGNAAQ